MTQLTNPPLASASIPILQWFVSQLLHFPSSSLIVAWENSRMAYSLRTLHHMWTCTQGQAATCALDALGPSCHLPFPDPCTLGVLPCRCPFSPQRLHGAGEAQWVCELLQPGSKSRHSGGGTNSTWHTAGPTWVHHGGHREALPRWGAGGQQVGVGSAGVHEPCHVLSQGPQCIFGQPKSSPSRAQQCVLFLCCFFTD